MREGGHLLNVASSSYTKGRENYALYSSAKAAVVNFTQALALEHPGWNVNVVVPQRTRTEMRLKNFVEENSADLLDPEEVAGRIVSVLRRERLTGAIIEVRKGCF